MPFSALPNIDIAITGGPRRFFEEVLTLDIEDFEIEFHKDAFGNMGLDCINLRYLGKTEHDGLVFKLISPSESAKRIKVETRASRWECRNLSREIYIKTTKWLVRPVIQKYNSKFNKNYRLCIKRTRNPIEHLSPNTRKLFNLFTDLANKESLHPLDYERFYELVWRSRQRITESDMTALLIEAGFGQEQSAYLADIYQHLLDFKKFIKER